MPVSGGVWEAVRALAQKPRLWALLALAAALGYGYAMAVPAVDMDDLALENYQQGGEFLRQGRFAVWLLQAATGIMRYRRFWPECFFAVCLALAGVALAGALYTAARRAPRVPGAALLGAGLVLWPYHAEILMYSNQCGVGLGYLLCALALCLALPHLLGGWRAGARGAAGAALCLAFALGLYESFAPVWLTLVFAALLLDAAAAPPHTRRAGGAVSAILRGVWPLAAGLALRQAFAAALRAVCGVTGENGTASSTIYWFRRASLREALVIPAREWLTNYAARAFGVPALALLALAALAVLAWAGKTHCGNGKALFAAGLILSQYALGLLQGTGAQMARASQCFAVFVPFAVWLRLAPALDAPRKKMTAKRLLAALLAAALLLVELTSLVAGFRFGRDRWRYERGVLADVAERLDALDPDGTLPVAFVGEVTLPDELYERLIIPRANPAYKVKSGICAVLGGPMGDLYRYENPQTLVINWAQDAFGGKEQMALLMQAVGRPCTLADADQQAEADALYAANQAPEGVSAREGYLLVNFGG